MNISLKHIAQTLKLSNATVSWVLSGKGDEKGISLITQRKVFQCVEQLNYQPNLLARSLRTGKSGTIGLIIPDITDSFYSNVARSIEFEAEAQGYSLMICSSESKIERENKMILLLKAKQVDGIIVAPTEISKIEIQNLAKESYPFVLFDRYFPEMQTNYIIIDNERSSYELVKRMINKGSSNIAIITTNPHLYTMNMRKEGYAKALNEANLPVDPDLYGEVTFVNYEENVFKTLDQIFSKKPDVDGFFFTTHILALEAFRYFYEKGININKGYELACIHGISAFRVLAPNMNIARMPIEGIGQNAVRILLKEIKYRMENLGGGREVETLVLPCSLS